METAKIFKTSRLWHFFGTKGKVKLIRKNFQFILFHKFLKYLTSALKLRLRSRLPYNLSHFRDTEKTFNIQRALVLNDDAV